MQMKSFVEQFGAEFAATAIEKGWSLETAKDEYIKTVVADRDAAKTEVEKLKADLDETQELSSGTDAASANEGEELSADDIRKAETVKSLAGRIGENAAKFASSLKFA